MRNFATIAAMLGLLSAHTASAEPRGTVLTVNPALAVLGQVIATPGLSLHYPGPPDQNAADWMPGNAELRAYQSADLILRVGADYAAWADTAMLPRARQVTTSDGFSGQFITTEMTGAAHRHGPTGADHGHSEIANHFWLDPALAKLQARAIATAFSELWPEAEPEFAGNLAKLETNLDQITTELAAGFYAFGAAQFLASHPVYQYLDRAFDLNLVSFHWEPDQTPDREDWEQFDAILSPDKPVVMLWEAPPNTATAQALAKRSVTVVVISPSLSAGDGSGRTLKERLGYPDGFGKNR